MLFIPFPYKNFSLSLELPFLNVSAIFTRWSLNVFFLVHFKSTGHFDTTLALPREVLTTLQSQLCSPKDVVDKLLQNLKLEHTSLEQPEPETRKWIRCLARNANCSNRLEVVKYLRQITPAGTTGRCDTDNVWGYSKVLDEGGPEQRGGGSSVFEQRRGSFIFSYPGVGSLIL